MLGRAQIAAIFTVAISLSLVFSYAYAGNDDEPVTIDFTITGYSPYGACRADIDLGTFLDAGFSLYDTFSASVGGIGYGGGVIVDSFAILPIAELFVCIDHGNNRFSIGLCFVDPGWEVGDSVHLEKTGHDDLGSRYARLLEPAKTRDQCTSDGEFANFREVTVGSIAEGRLFRSVTPIYAATGERNAASDSLASLHGIDFFIGLSVGSETVDDMYASGRLNGTYYKSIYETGMVDNHFATTNLFSDPVYGGKLRCIIDNDRTFGISCTLGQDRTGFMVLLVEMLMGGTLDEIRDDYMQSFYNFNGITGDVSEYGYVLSGRFYHQLVGIHEVGLVSTPELIDWDQDVSGFDLQSDAAAFMKALYGFTDSEITALQERLSTPPA